MNKSTKTTVTWFLISALSATVLPPLVQQSLSVANYILMVVGALISAMLASVLVYAAYKERKADRVIQEAAEKDSIWDPDEMKIQARSMVYKLQSAWDSRDASGIKDYATPPCYAAYDAEIKNRPAGDTNPAGLLDVQETRIVCCQDHPGNNEDKYAAFIDGSLKFGESDRDFRVILHFVRSGNDWLLEKISERAGIWDLLLTRNVEEEAR